MGLDMYAYVVGKHPENTDTSISKHAKQEEFKYWRKFNALHGWMERLFRERGNIDESFNCIPIRLTIKDLDKLESDAINNRLYGCPGFFWGSVEDADEEEIKDVVEFVRESLNHIRDGFEVYYDSWW